MSSILNRFFGWILDRIAGDRELDVDTKDRPYYPGEVDYPTSDERFPA